MAEENDVKEVKSARSPVKLIVIGLLLAVVATGGYFGWNMFKKKADTPEQVSERPAASKQEKAAVVPLDSFIINLMEKSGSGKRYLKVGMILEIGRQGQTVMVEEHRPQIRDTILLLLSSKTSDDIGTMEGKLELKQQLLSRINQILGEVIVSKIYFTEFVVQ